MKQLTFNDINELLGFMFIEPTTKEPTVEEANEALQQAIEEDACATCNDKNSMTLIEEVIYNFLATCKKESKLPTLEEAQTISILDTVNSNYQ